MRRILIAFGALGGGTAVAFALAAAAFLADPNGRLVPVSPLDTPVFRQPPVVVDGGPGFVDPPVMEPPVVKPIPLPPAGGGADGAESG